MSAGDLPVLYSFRRCPYAMRARLAILESGRTCELREVTLRSKPQALLDASPKATVPVVVDVDGSVIDQSLDIMQWALRRQDPRQWLQCASDTHELIAQCDIDFKHHLDRYKYPDRYDGADQGRHREQAAAWLRQLDERLARQGWLCGSQETLADVAIFPFVRQFAHTDRDWFAAQPWPALAAWLQDYLESPRFARIMEKFPAWQPGDAPRIFPE